MASRIDGDPLQSLQFFPPKRIDERNCVDRIAEELDADRPVVFVRRKDLDDVPADAKCPPVEVDIVSFVLHLDET